MQRSMVLKSASAKAQPEGAIIVRIGLECSVSRDMALDILNDLGEMLDKGVSVDVQLIQNKLNLKKV